MVFVLHSVRDETVQDYTIRANVLATSGTALEQGSKIGLGQTKTVTAMFSSHQVPYLKQHHSD